MAESATILIPDISGYTEFLTKTELVHSSHIINELLEAILAANSGEFVLSEVEGDALLLYHKGKPIEADALVRQCLSMFESFHTQLKIIERDSICQCGACKTASNLTLKFVAHHGMVQEIKVMQFTKCSGVDMVVAHRLMKNRIASDEYILATPSCFDFSSLEQSPGALAWERSSDEYPAIGKIEYQYAPLAESQKNHRGSNPANQPGDRARGRFRGGGDRRADAGGVSAGDRSRPANPMAVGRRAPRPACDHGADRSAARLHIPRPDRRVGSGQERYRRR